jgi:NAD(P)-dependent dehydrogenase (short-subunit alcohol dehydrogenase family)
MSTTTLPVSETHDRWQASPLDGARHDRRLLGSVALVTGAGRGIGQLVATAFAEAGAAVALVARSETELTRTVEIIEAAGGTAAAVAADVTDPGEMAAAVADLRGVLGPFDLLVNNAGVMGPIGPLWEIDADEWWRTMDVNVRGIVLCSRLVLPDMVAAQHGRIINITSQAGVHRWPLMSAYSVSKAAVVKLTENLALETRRHGTAVFSVHPGLLPIGMSETMAARTPLTAYEGHVRDWALNELAEGRGADPARAVELLIRVAAGDADGLSGRHLSVHDDLDAVLHRLPEVRARDLYVMRPEPLSTRDGAERSRQDLPTSPTRRTP